MDKARFSAALPARLKRRRALPDGRIVGRPMSPPIAAGERMGSVVCAAIRAMREDVQAEMAAVFEDAPEARMAIPSAQDASVTSSAEKRIFGLQMKWRRFFDALATKSTQEMIGAVLRQSDSAMRSSLKELAESFKIDTSYQDKRLSEVISASTTEAANLIRRIPAQYLEDVQGQVMRSITSGAGMKDLVPYLENRYQGDLRWARHVAMDQTRKSFASISETRMRRVGVEEYKWLHSQGGRYPRWYHKKELNGKIFRWDDPPWIDPPSAKNRQRGHPGTAIFCRCTAAPVFSFLKSKERATVSAQDGMEYIHHAAVYPRFGEEFAANDCLRIDHAA